MENQEKVVTGVEDIKDGPADGVSMETQGTYTKFAGLNKNRRIVKQNVCPVGIKASIELGVVSISDRAHDVMLTVTMEDMTRIMAAAYERAASKDKEGKECQVGNPKTTGTSVAAPDAEQE